MTFKQVLSTVGAADRQRSPVVVCAEVGGR